MEWIAEMRFPPSGMNPVKKWALPGAVSVEEKNETHDLGTCCHNNDGLISLCR
jgi:hypothetical protein